MAGTVTNGLATITNAESADSANWDDWGAGGGSGQNTDIVVQGADSRSRRIDNTTRGFGYDVGSADDQSATGNHVGFWTLVLQPSLITNLAVHLGDSATGAATNNYEAHNLSSAQYSSLPIRAGFRRIWLDVSRTPDTTGGTLSLANVRNFGIEFNMGNVGGTTDNCYIDGLHHGIVGLTLTGGSAGSPAVWDDLIQYDINTTDDRQLGILDGNFLSGAIQIGNSGSATVFRGGNEVILASIQPLASTDWIRVDWNAENASADILGGSMTFSGVCHTFTGTSGTIDLQTLSILGCPGTTTLTSAVTWIGKIANSATLFPSTADITDLTIQESSSESGLSLSASNSSTGLVFINNNVSGDLAHSIEIDTAGTYTFAGWSFSNSLGRARKEFNANTDVDNVNDEVDITAHGFSTGDAVVYTNRGEANNIGLTPGNTYFVRAVTVNAIAFYSTQSNAESDTSRLAIAPTAGSETHSVESGKADVFVNLTSGTVTINVTGSGDVPTLRIADGTATATASSSVTFTVNTDQTGCDIRVFDDADDSELAGTASGNTLNYAYNGADAPITANVVVQKLGFEYVMRKEFTLDGTNQTLDIQLEADTVENNP